MRIGLLQHLINAVRTRYKVYTEDEAKALLANPGQNFVADTFYPSMVMENIGASTNHVFLSPQFAAISGRPCVPTEEMVKWLGVPKKAIKEALLELKEKQITLVMIGYGGYGINTLYYLNELCRITGVTNIFKHLAILEEDVLSFSNTLRIAPDINAQPCKAMDKPSKLEIFANAAESYDGVICESISLVAERFTTEMVTEIFDNIENVVYLGAPDFETRKVLEDKNFIFGGHSNNDVVCVSRPVVDEGITTESYGTINLNVFFLNMLRGAIELPKLLALDELPTNELLFRYNVAEAKIKVPSTYTLTFGETNE